MIGALGEVRADLPTGLVTFLFTDIEGSTRLVQSLDDDAWARVLGDHARLIREAAARHGGVEVNTEGDAFFIVFSDAADALAATVDAQLALGAHSWPDDGLIRVRMGLHTGEGRLGSRDYIGMAVHHAARVASAGHGGQIVVSSDTVDALKVLPADTTLRSLGPHRLKDLGAPVELHQVCHAGLDADFAPLRTLERVVHNLPVQPSSFLGRNEDLTAVGKLLASHRLVTLTGAGGTGKTRLALQLAAEVMDRFPDGIWVAELAPVADPALVPGTVLGSIGLREDPGRSPTQTVVDHLRGRRALIILDNCEHVIDSAAELADALVRGGERAYVLTTSREPLRVTGETVFALGAMGIPEGDAPMEVAISTDAVRLFCERAGEADTGFSLDIDNAKDIASICTRLDGMPLALELAAAWVRSLSPAQIAQRLGKSLDLLDKGPRGVSPRQASLRAAIAWSHDLLSEGEQRLFARLSVFAGGWTLETAEEVCAGDGVETHDVFRLMDALVDKSLVTRDLGKSGSARYRMLETIGAFASEKLVSAGRPALTADQHARVFIELARTAAQTPEGSIAEARVFDGLDNEAANFLSALQHLHAAASFEEATDMTLALARWWEVRGHWPVAQAELSRCLAAGQLTSATRPKLLLALGRCELAMQNYDVGGRILEEALDAARRQEDRVSEARALHLLGSVAQEKGDLPLARSRQEEALGLAREIGDRRTAILADKQLTDVEYQSGDYGPALARFEEQLLVARDLGDAQIESGILSALASVRVDFRGEFLRPGEELREALALSRELGDRALEVGLLVQLAEVSTDAGDKKLARTLREEALGKARLIGLRSMEVRNLMSLGRIASREGDFATAERYLDQGLALAREMGDPFRTFRGLLFLGRNAASSGDWGKAGEWAEQALTVAREMGRPGSILLAMSDLGHAALGAGNLDEAEAVWLECLTVLRPEQLRDRAQLQGYLGDVRLDRDDLSGARTHYASALAAGGELDSSFLGSPQRLEQGAGLLARANMAEAAVELLAAAAAMEREPAVHGSPVHDQRVAATEKICRDALDHICFEAAWLRGTAMDWPTALAQATELLDQLEL